MMAKSTKKIIVGVLALSCAGLLASCDPAESLPLNYESPIVNKDGEKVDLVDNQMGVIYDAVSSNKTDKVLSELLYNIGVDQFGDWKKIVELATGTGTETAIDEFINDERHQKTYCLKDDEKLVTETYTLKDIRRQRFYNFYEDMMERVNEVFYNEITSKSYNDDDGLYHEMRLAVAHYGEMYKIEELDLTKDEDETDWYVSYLTPDLKKEDVSSYVHLDRYADYIERKIVPQIYKDKMVEEYLIENNWSTLGRAYGRKVNMIKITHDSKTVDVADKLFQDFVDDYVVDIEPDDEINLEIIANAWKGFAGLTEDGIVVPLEDLGAEELLLAGRPELHEYVDLTILPEGDLKNNPVGVEGYYTNTELGKIMEDYGKACNAEGDRFAKEEDKNALNSFTNSGAQSKEKGLKSKVIELALKDYTTNDWFVKNSGINELPSELANRLFNINVSNAVDNFSEDEMETALNFPHYGPSVTNNKAKQYVRYINSHYFLTPAASQQASENARNFIIHDKDSNAFYLVMVEEAASTAKLNINSEDGYKAMKDDPLFSEEVAREIAQILGTKDSYVTDAQASYIKLYALVYHDKAVYDYFKSKYPDLFDEEN